MTVKKSKTVRGFTLLELLIYISLVVIITLAVSRAFVILLKGSSRVDARLEVTSNIRFALDKINQDIQLASSVDIPAAAGDSSDTLIMTVDGDEITYCIINDQIRRAEAIPCDGNAEPITSYTMTVDALNFTRLENTNTILSKTFVSIQTMLTGSYNSQSTDYAYTLTKQITTQLP